LPGQPRPRGMPSESTEKEVAPGGERPRPAGCDAAPNGVAGAPSGCRPRFPMASQGLGPWDYGFGPRSPGRASECGGWRYRREKRAAGSVAGPRGSRWGEPAPGRIQRWRYAFRHPCRERMGRLARALGATGSPAAERRGFRGVPGTWSGHRCGRRRLSNRLLRTGNEGSRSIRPERPRRGSPSPRGQRLQRRGPSRRTAPVRAEPDDPVGLTRQVIRASPVWGLAPPRSWEHAGKGDLRTRR